MRASKLKQILCAKCGKDVTNTHILARVGKMLLNPLCTECYEKAVREGKILKE